MAEPTTLSQALGVSDAQAQIADLLNPPAEEKDEVVSEVADVEEESSEIDGEVEYESEEEPDEELEEDDDAEYEDDEEELDGDEASTADTFTVKVAGEEIEVGLDELKNGYSRTSDYTKKSQSLAEERKAFEQDRESVNIERQQYSQLLGQLQIQLTTGGEEPPDFDRLYEEDPIEASRQQHNWQKKQQKLQAIQMEQQRVSEAQAHENQNAVRELIQSEVVRLPELIPEWKDETVAAKERDDLKSYLVSQGVNEEELNALVRAPHIAVLRKAMLYDKGQRRVKKSQKAQKGKSVRPGSKGGTPTNSNRKLKSARQRLAKNGSRGDAANLIEQMLK
tara:strand:- start:65 stop:1072 length:1008 start_codon:yes stop_codon:yes gene_type:complete